MNRECVTCRHINNCATVTPEKILAHFVCQHFVEVEHPEEVMARCTIISTFGESGLRALISPAQKED